MPKTSDSIDGIGDPTFRRRMLYAIAFSIAAHEILAGVWPVQPPPPPPPKVVSERIRIDRPKPKPTPKPTPPPTPVPTPKVTPAPHYTLAPKIVVRAPAAKAAATPTHKLGGAAAVKHIVRITPPPSTPRPAPPVSLAQGTHQGQQNGGSGTGAGAGNGTGGQAGAGTGSGTTGTGTGGDANTAPCGIVELDPIHVSFRKDGTSVQTVSVTVRLRDGASATDTFPYPFIYPSERENPFLHDDKLSNSGGVFLQQPPQGSDISQMPATVQTVLAHTNPATGTTTFPECPGTPAHK